MVSMVGKKKLKSQLLIVQLSIKPGNVGRQLVVSVQKESHTPDADCWCNPDIRWHFQAAFSSLLVSVWIATSSMLQPYAEIGKLS